MVHEEVSISEVQLIKLNHIEFDCFLKWLLCQQSKPFVSLLFEINWMSLVYWCSYSEDDNGFVGPNEKFV